MPGSRLEVSADAGHMPHDADPSASAAVLTDFLHTTGAARLTADHRQPLLADEADAS
jgi:hypothetical protein